jgi:dTDP-4-amino-4,6-dideoxygalactose transaminase
MMSVRFFDLTSQYASIRQDIDCSIQKVIESAAFIGGPFVSAFEQAYAEFCGGKHCVGVANGTDALVVALRALGIGPGDEVIVPANTFIATAEAVTLAGAKVVFVDIDPTTYNIDAERIGAAITSRTRAIIAVHLYGQPADMDAILDVARAHGLCVIEDAAQAHGATYKGRTIGSIGDVACFSFYPSKNLGAYGDGGAIVTNSDSLAHKARLLINHGGIEKYSHEIEGLNSRLDGIQAAVLHVKLTHLPTWTESRRRHARLYSELLAGTDIVTPVELPAVTAVYHLYVVRIRADLRDTLRAFLQERGVATDIHYPTALPHLPAYAYLNHPRSAFPEATRAAAEVVSLPMYPELTRDDIAYVCESLAAFQLQPALQLTE